MTRFSLYFQEYSLKEFAAWRQGKKPSIIGGGWTTIITQVTGLRLRSFFLKAFVVLHHLWATHKMMIREII